MKKGKATMKKRNKKAAYIIGLALAISSATAGTALAGSWAKDNTGWWYDNGNGTYPASSWQWIDGAWYYFDSNGYMKTGWINNTYYCAESGAMVTGWRQIGGNWYFFAENGTMVKNQWMGDYYLLSSGKMATSRWIDGYWVDSDGKWDPDYEEDDDDDDDSSDYSGGGSSISGSGSSGSGSSGSDSDSSGSGSSSTDDGSSTASTTAATGEYQDGWILNFKDGSWSYYENGKKVTNRFISSIGHLYYVDESGNLLKNTTITVNGKKYQIDSDGIATERKEEETKEASSMAISGHTRIVSHTVGDDFPINGVITSNYKINSIRVTLKSSGDSMIYEKIFNPNAKEFDLASLSINSADIYRISSRSKATLMVRAEDEGGLSMPVINETFEVKKPESVKFQLSGETLPRNVSYGCNFGLYGVITCNYDIDEVDGRICKKSNGSDVVMRKEVYPNSKTYDIHGPINDALVFERLEKGSYYYIVTVKANGKEKEIIKKSFKVQ